MGNLFVQGYATLDMAHLTVFGRIACAMTATVAALLVFTLLPVSAHTKWVVTHPEVQRFVPSPMPRFFLEASTEYPWVAPLALGAILTAFALDRVLEGQFSRLQTALFALRFANFPILRVVLGILLVRSALYGHFFFPNLPIAWGAVRVIEGILGVALIVGILPRLCAAAVGVLYTLGFAAFGVALLDYPVVPGICVWLVLRLNKEGWGYGAGWENRCLDRIQRWAWLATPVLRVTCGISLIIPAVDKFFSPEANLTVILKYGIRVPGVSDRLFLYGAGWVELIFGLLILLGPVPRLVGGVFLLVFGALTVVGSSAFKMQGEIFDHLPFLAFAVVYLLEGKRARLRDIATMGPAAVIEGMKPSSYRGTSDLSQEREP